jgi:cation transporter-like permease
MNLETKIIKESFGVLILASVISALGGVGLQAVREKILLILPLLILFPALNGMVGNFGTIFASHYTTMSHQNKLGKKKFMNKALKKHYKTLLKVSLIAAFYISTLSSVIALLKGFNFTPLLYTKILLITLITTACLVSLIAVVSVVAGNYFIKKKEDPDNLLIPITTSIADLGSMIIFSLLIFAFF